MAKKKEYRVVQIERPDLIEDIINELADDEWEFVAIEAGSSFSKEGFFGILIMERDA